MAAELSVIIVSYNSAAFLRQCIGSLVEQRCDLPVEVIVVDNASKDDSVATVERHFPDAVIIRNAKNLGFAKANNQGIERASGRLLLIQNPDTVMLPGLLRALVDFLAQTPEAGAASGRILNADLTDQGTARRFPTVWSGLFGRHSLLTRLLPNNRFSRRYMMTEMRGSTEPYEVDWLSTASMLVRRDVIDLVGGMDEEFFYWVDGEWCQRIRKGGWKIFCVPPAAVIHEEGKGSGHRTRAMRNRIIIDFHRGAYRLFCKHYALGPLGIMRYVALGCLSARALMQLALNSVRK